MTLATAVANLARFMEETHCVSARDQIDITITVPADSGDWSRIMGAVQREFNTGDLVPARFQLMGFWVALKTYNRNDVRG